MPFRSESTLQSWLEEFERLGYGFAGETRVIQQDGADGANTGLISVELPLAATIATIQPESRDSARWVITMERLESSVTLDAPALITLASELTVVSTLCAFLQAKSLAHRQIDAA